MHARCYFVIWKWLHTIFSALILFLFPSRNTKAHPRLGQFPLWSPKCPHPPGQLPTTPVRVSSTFKFSEQRTVDPGICKDMLPKTASWRKTANCQAAYNFNITDDNTGATASLSASTEKHTWTRFFILLCQNHLSKIRKYETLTIHVICMPLNYLG